MRPLIVASLLGLTYHWTLLGSVQAKPAPAKIQPVVWQPVRSFPLAKRFGDQRAGASLMAFSPDGKTLIAGGENCTLQSWDVASGREHKLLARPFTSTYAMAFSPDGRYLALGTSKLVGVSLWDTHTGQLKRTFKEPYPQSKGAHVFDLAFTPNGKTLIANTGGNYQFWNVGSGRLQRKIASKRRQYGLALSPDGNTLAGGFFMDKGAEGYPARVGLCLWYANSGWLRHTFNSMGWPLSFSPDGKQLLVRRTEAQYASRLGQFYLSNGALWTRSQVKITANGDANPVAFSPNGRWLAVGHDDGSISIFDGHTKAKQSFLPQVQTISAGKGYLLSLAFSPDGSLLAASNDSGHLNLWRVRQ